MSPNEETIYRVSWIQGNGYRCQCCRREWDEYSDFYSQEEAVEFINNKKAIAENPTSKQYENDEDDVCNFVLSTIIEEKSF